MDLDLMRSSYTYFNAYQRENLDGSVIFSLVRLVLAKNCRYCLSVSNAVYRLSRLACFVSEISGGGVRSWPRPPSVRGLGYI